MKIEFLTPMQSKNALRHTRRRCAQCLAVILVLTLGACGGPQTMPEPPAEATARPTAQPAATASPAGLFSDAEIRQAIETVQAAFADSFEGCTLLKVEYDPAASGKQAEDYLTYGRGSVNGVARENVIVLFSEFETGPEGSGGWEANETYRGWMWFLIRENAGAAWVVDDMGY